MASESAEAVQGAASPTDGQSPTDDHGAVTAGTVQPSESEETAAFPPFDATTFASQLLWFVITFVVFYLLMARVALPRIAGILEGRRDRIAADLDQADSLKSQSEEAEAAYEKALADARANASQIAGGARDEAKAKAAQHQAKVEAEMGEKLAAAESRIAEIKDRAIAEVGTIAGDTTDALVKALVGQDATAKEVKDAVSAALAERNRNA